MFRVTSGEVLKVILPSGLTASGVVSNQMTDGYFWTLTSTGSQTNTTGVGTYNGNDGGNRTVSYTVGTSLSNIQLIAWDVGLFLNPDSVRYLDSFIVTFGSDTVSSIPLITYTEADLASASVTNEVQTAASANLITLTFRLTNDIPQNGKIVINWPSEVSFAQTSSTATSLITVTIYGVTKTSGTYTVTVSQGSRSITLTDLFSSNALSVQDSDIVIAIDEMKNPESQITSSSFTITTQNSASENIDKRSTGLTISSTEPGTVTVSVLSYSSSTVDTNFTASFIGSTDINPSNATFRLYWPSEVSLAGTTISGSRILGFSTSTSPCTLNNTGGYVDMKYYNSNTNFVFSVSTLKNPLGEITTSSWQIYIYDSSGNLIMQETSGITKDSTAATLTVNSATRNSSTTTVGISSNYDLTFTLTTRILSDSTIKFYFPIDQVKYNTSTTCYNGSTALTGTFADTNSTYFETEITQWCNSTGDGSVGSSITLTLKNAVNPSYITDPLSSSVMIYTINNQLSTSVIDEITSGVQFSNSLTPGTLTDIIFTKNSTTNKVGEETSWTVTLTVVTELSSGGQVKLMIPSEAIYRNPSSEVVCTDNSDSSTLTGSSTYDSDDNISEILITDACPSGGTVGTAFSYKISNVFNPGSTKTISSSFDANTQTSEGYLVDEGTAISVQNKNIVSNSFTSITVNSPVSPIIVGEITEYDFDIVLTNNIPSSGGKLTITFPTQITVYSTGSGTAIISDTSHECSINSTAKTGTITFNSDATAGSTLNVVFINSIQNPTIGNLTNAITFKSTVTESQSTYNIDSDTTTVTIEPDTYNTLTSGSVTRVDSSQKDTSTSINIAATSVNPIRENSTILFYFPLDQVQLESTVSALTFYKLSSSDVVGAQLTPTVSAVISGSYITVTFKEWCSSSASGPANTENIRMQVQGFKNPSTTYPPSNSFEIFIDSSDGYKIDSIESSLFATPSIQAGKLTNVVISRDSNVVGASTTYTVSFTTANDFTETNGIYFSFTPPSGLLYTDSSSSISGTYNTSSVTSSECKVTNSTVTYGDEVTSFKVLMDGYTSSCAVDNYSITFTGLLNPFSTEAPSGTITVATQGYDGSQYYNNDVLDLTISSNVSSLQTLTPNTATGTAVRSVTTVDTSTTIECSITLTNRILAGSYVRIKIPLEQFQKTGSSIKYIKSGGTTSNAMTEVSTDSNHVIVQFVEFCSNGADLGADGTTMTITISQGFKNARTVVTTFTQYFVYQTYTSDLSYQIDESTDDISATPDLDQATISSISVTFEDSVTALDGYVDISAVLGSTVLSTDYIEMTFSYEFLLNTSSTVTCQKVDGSTVSSLTCSTTFTSGYLTYIKVEGLCSCDSTSTYVIRLNSINTLLEAKAFTGTLTYSTQASATEQIGTGSLDLSTLTTLTAAELQSTTVVRAVTSQGADSTFTITFTTPGELLDSSTLILSLPLNQIEISSGSFAGKDASTSTSLTCSASPTADSTYNYLTLSEWKCTSGNGASGTVFSLILSNAKNPDVASVTTDAFLIDIYSPSSNMIFQAPANLDATPELEVGPLNNHVITFENTQYVLDTTEYLISFESTTDVGSGGYFMFEFPENRIWKNGTSGITVFSGSDYSTTIIDITVTYDASDVSVTKIVLNSYCASGGNIDSYYFKFAGGISNPDYVPTITGNFITYSTDSSGAIINRDIVSNDDVDPILPYPMTATITRSVTTLGASTALTVSFTTANPFPDGGKILFYMPTDQISLGSSQLCYESDQTTSITCTIETSGSYYIITLNEWGTSGGDDCAGGTSLEFYITGVTNPSLLSANVATTSWEVLTADSSSNAIDGAYSDLFPSPDLEGVSVTVTGATVDNPVVYTETTLTVIFTPNSDLPSAARVEIGFPTGFASLPSTKSCSQTLPSTSSLTCSYTTSSGYITAITITDPCSHSDCKSTTSHIYTMAITMRENTKDVGGSFSVLTKTTSSDIGIGSVSNTVTISPNPFDNPTFDNGGGDTILETSCTLIVSFDTVYDFPNKSNGGKIALTIPDDLTVFSTGGTATIGSLTMEGSLAGKSVTATHSSSTSVAGMTISITFANITNPSSTKPTESFVIYSQEKDSGTYYSIDGIESDFGYYISSLGTISSATVVRDNINTDNDGYKVNRATNFLFTFTIGNELDDSDSSFTIIMPEESDAKISSSATSITCSATSGTGTSLTCTADSSTRTVLVSGYCSTSAGRSCAAGAEINICLKKSFMKNMGWIKSPIATTDSFTIKSGLSGGLYYIDGISESVVATPDLLPDALVLISPGIERDNNTINALVVWTMYLKFSSNSLSSTGYIVVTIPEDVVYDIGETVDATLLTNSSTVVTTESTLYSSDAINIINIYNVGGTSGCSTGSLLNITLEWMKNPPEKVSVSDSITVQSVTADGWVIDEVSSSTIDTLFSELETASITGINISPADPSAGESTNYDIIFTADTDIPQDSVLIITLPSDITISDLNSGGSTTLDTGANLFDTSTTITCTVGTDANGNTIITVEGLFPDTTNSGQFGIDLGLLLNPSTTGDTGSFGFEIVSPEGNTVASETTDATTEIKTPIDDANCDPSCATCSGTTTSCDSGVSPSNQPFLDGNSGVDSCSSGKFLYELECFDCHQSGAEGSGYMDSNCLSCNDGYYFEDGYGVTSCSKNTVVVDDACTSTSANGDCSSNCITCSKTLTWCLSCNSSSDTPIINPVDGTGVGDSNGSCDSGYYVDASTQSCEKGSTRCQECELSSTSCFECWDFFIDNLMDWGTFTCRSDCSSSSYYDTTDNVCYACNPVCLTCSGSLPTEGLTGDETPGGAQLYYDSEQSEGVLSCRKPYVEDEGSNTGVRSNFEFVSVPTIILIVLIILAILTLIITKIIFLTKNRNAYTFEGAYAYFTAIEFVDRIFLLGNLWASAKIFSFAVGFMDIVTTGTLGVFFYNLFLEPIFIHSPYFRNLYRRKKSVFLGIVITSFIVGVNFVRIFQTFILGGNLNVYYFYVKPLNNMANFTLILTCIQIIIGMVNLFDFVIGEDAWDLSVFGLGLNMLLVLFQMVKIFETQRFQNKYQAINNPN